MLQQNWLLSVKTTHVGVAMTISHPWEGNNTVLGQM